VGRQCRSDTTPSELGWYRLRYKFTPSVNGSDTAPVHGVLQMGHLMVDSFELRITAAGLSDSERSIRYECEWTTQPRESRSQGFR